MQKCMKYTVGDFDWNHARAFLAAAEEGSLSAAARALDLAQPTVGRQISALEERLGVVLFERAGRSIALTPNGLDLLEHVRAMGDAANRVSLAASGRVQAVDGLVRVTASDLYCAHLLPPALDRLAAIAPLLQIDLVADSEVRDLLRREADVAIRHVRPEQPDLISRRLRDATAHFYAAPRYLERRGRPGSLEALSSHDFVGFGDDRRMLEHLKALGVSPALEKIRFGSKSGVVAWEMARAGLGVAVMADAVAHAAPEMERLLPEMQPIRFPVWLATHRDLRASRRIRLVFGHLAEFMA